jgi:hypothetical protein
VLLKMSGYPTTGHCRSGLISFCIVPYAIEDSAHGYWSGCLSLDPERETLCRPGDFTRMKTKQAKDFLVQQTAEQATRENISLSDIEKKMMYFTESDATSYDHPVELNEEFEAQYDTAEYEAKISRLLHHAYNRLKVEDPEGKRSWDQAVRTLRKGDHYFLVLWDTPCGERRKGDSFKLLATALLIAASIAMAAFLAAKYNIDIDRYRKYLLALVVGAVLLASGTFRLLYRIGVVWFHRRDTEDDDSN